MARRDELRRIERSITRIARISLGRSAARHRADLSGIELSRPQISILAVLNGSGAMRLSTLSALTHLEAPLVSREIRQLENDGFVTRVADPDDGRAAIVEATELGQATFERYRATTDAIIAETFADWRDGDLSELVRNLERLEVSFTRVPTGRQPDEGVGTNAS